MGSQSSYTFDSINQPSLPGTPGIFVGPAAIVPVGLNDSVEEMRSPMSQSSSQISQISAIRSEKNMMQWKRPVNTKLLPVLAQVVK